jgi:hypothetical protein
MGYIKIFFTLFFTLTILQGCNIADNDSASPPPPVEKDNDLTNQENTRQGEVNLFNFTSFYLDVDYSKNQSYEIDYESDQDGMESEITDELSNKTLKGNDAFDQLRPKFENFTFDSSTPDEDVISEVSKAFNISKNYYSFELDVEFTDGKEKRYNKINK